MEPPRPPSAIAIEPWPTSAFDPAGEDVHRQQAAAESSLLHLHRQFPSAFLPDARDLIVYLPPQYGSEPDRRFPVLLMHDGQNLFDGRTSYIPGHTWRMRESADAAILAGEVAPLVIVGIYNTGARRIAEYTPTRDWKLGGGEAKLYGRLLIEELLPFISRTYRTLEGCEHTGLGGSSLGGLVSLYLGLENPEVFGRLAVHSPSIWWNSRSILKSLAQAKLSKRSAIWLDVGDGEGARTVEDATLLYHELIRLGWTAGETLHYEICDGGGHNEDSWAARVRPMLRFLFPCPAK